MMLGEVVGVVIAIVGFTLSTVRVPPVLILFPIASVSCMLRGYDCPDPLMIP